MAVLGLDLRIGSSQMVSERPGSSHGCDRRRTEEKLEADPWKEVLCKMDEISQLFSETIDWFAEEARLDQLRSQSRREEEQRLKEALATRFEIPSIGDEARPQDQDREVGESCNEVLRNELVARRERRREEPLLHRHRQVECQRNSISVADPVDSTAAHQVLVDLPQLNLVFYGEDEVINPHVEALHPQEWRPKTSAKLCQALGEVVDLVAEQAALKLQPASLWPTTRGSTSSLFFKALEARAEAEEFDALWKLVRKRLVFDPGGAIPNCSKPHFLTTSSSALSFLIKPWCLYSIQGKIKKLVRLTLRTRSVLRGWVCQRPKPSSSAAVLFSTAEPSSSINSSSLRLAN